MANGSLAVIPAHWGATVGAWLSALETRDVTSAVLTDKLANAWKNTGSCGLLAKQTYQQLK